VRAPPDREKPQKTGQKFITTNATERHDLIASGHRGSA